MPGRLIPLINDEIYHIINRGIASQPVFLDKRDYHRTLEILSYYQNINPPLKYSKFLILAREERLRLLNELKTQNQFLVEILAFCLMPNHFHLLLKQTVENGISTFVGNLTNSYTRYSNTKRERRGPIFEGRFKAVRIETNEQLLHVSRYIHLNPYTSYVVEDLKALENYPFSSFPEYLGKSNSSLCLKDPVLGSFKDFADYRQFIFDQADYQRMLNNIKHLLLES